MKFVGKHPCLSFATLVVLTPYVVLLPLLAIGVDQQTLKPLKLPLACTPLAYAVLVAFCVDAEEGVARLFGAFWSKRTKIFWYIAALFVFPVMALATLAIRYFVDGFFPGRSEFASWGTMIAFSVPLLLFPGVTEEFAWRGFLQKRLEDKAHWWIASLGVGCVWGAWHGFDFLLGNWTFNWTTIGGYPVYILSNAVIIGWLFRRGGHPVFLAMVAHFSSNAANFYTPVFEEYRGSALPAYLYIGGLGGLALLLPIVDHFLPGNLNEDSHEQD